MPIAHPLTAISISCTLSHLPPFLTSYKLASDAVSATKCRTPCLLSPCEKHGRAKILQLATSTVSLAFVLYWLHIAGILDAELGARMTQGVSIFIALPQDLAAWISILFLTTIAALAACGRLRYSGGIVTQHQLLGALAALLLFLWLQATRVKGISYGNFEVVDLSRPTYNTSLPCEPWNFSASTNDSAGHPCVLKGLQGHPRLPPEVFRRNYRLGNILDNWFTVGVANEVMPDIERHSKHSQYFRHKDKLDEAIRWISRVRGGANGTFAQFLASHIPIIPPEHIPINTTVSSRYWKGIEFWWLYEYGAMMDVHKGFQAALRQAIELFVYEAKIAVPLYDPHTCVVHYRLGDMLAHTLDPVSMAHAMHGWSMANGLEILEVVVLGGGNLVHLVDSASDAAMVTSQNILAKFMDKLHEMMPKVRAEGGTGI